MNTMHAALVGLLTVLLATTAAAQTQPVASAGTSALGGQSLGIGPGRGQNPTPLFMLGGLAVGIWTRVPPPYDVSANHNLAANPLP
jgi:hypothetical protein